ncbi:MAG: hypothetical protein ACLFTA_01065 [Candidatus Nanohaloarchaea archaeon]
MEFKLFGRLRDDEEPGESGTGLSGGSLERTVENMFQQGYSEEEIKDELEGQYSPAEISRAVNNTVTSSATDSGGPEPMTPYQENSEEAVSPMDEGYEQEEETQASPGQQDQGLSQQQPQQQQNRQPQQIQQELQPQGEQSQGTVDPAVEELVETIVAEQFERVRNEFQTVYDEIDIIAEELEELDQRVHDLEVRDDEDQEEFIQKVDEMEDHIDSYQSRIGGLEKAFQQVLPSLVDNVKELTSLVQEIKDEEGIETSQQVSEEDVDDIDMSDW